MEREEIISFWGRDNLKRWSEANLRDVAIPRSSKSFLAEVGLPLAEKWTLRFDSKADQLPRLPNKSSCRRIGLDDVVPICLDEQHSGRIVAVEEGIGGTERYINSSVESFGQCLVLYQQYRTAARVSTEEDVQKVIITTEEQMRKIDPTAFRDPDNWWPVIVEQMKQGLL